MSPGTAQAAGVELKMAQSNNGMHPTRASSNGIRKIESLLHWVRAGDAGRWAATFLSSLVKLWNRYIIASLKMIVRR
jgi:hypothetical protein